LALPGTGARERLPKLFQLGRPSASLAAFLVSLPRVGVTASRTN
jgi:hypothetical protein